jgi:hypothetical protein
MEDPDDKARSYSIATSSKNQVIADVLAQYRERKFRAARRFAFGTRPQSGALSR